MGKTNLVKGKFNVKKILTMRVNMWVTTVHPRLSKNHCSKFQGNT